jgi:hypothetical protein
MSSFGLPIFFKAVAVLCTDNYLLDYDVHRVYTVPFCCHTATDTIQIRASPSPLQLQSADHKHDFFTASFEIFIDDSPSH